jgi:hypothetical protein
MGRKISKRKIKRQFVEDYEVKEAVQSWLKATPKSFFLEGIRKLVDSWTKFVAKQGDSVEKYDTNNFYKYYCKKNLL